MADQNTNMRDQVKGKVTAENSLANRKKVQPKFKSHTLIMMLFSFVKDAIFNVFIYAVSLHQMHLLTALRN